MTKEKNNSVTENDRYNRATKMQLFLFSFNNLSTNLPFMIVTGYMLFYAQSYLMLSAVIVGWIITGMRLFDGFTDPLIGFLIDRTDSKFGKFRPWIFIGNIIINITFIVMFSMINTDWSVPVKLFVFILFYVLHIIGYSMQTASTKGGGTVITSDPSQRSILAMYMGAIGGVIMVLFMSVIPLMAGRYELNMLDPEFWQDLVIMTSILSFIFMLLAIVGLWKKDVKENYQGFKNTKVKLIDFWYIIKGNRAIQMLIISAATDKLAYVMLAAVQVYLYSNIFMDQGLQAIMGFVTLPLVVIFTVIGSRIGVKITQKNAFVVMTWVSLITSVISLFFFPSAGATTASFTVIMFLIFFSLRTGASQVPGTFVVTMISDCSDYEVYLSGKSTPGMMGTLFSFIDKLVSSLNGVIIALMFGLFGLANTVIVPLTPATDYPGLELIIITGMIIMPILGYVASIIAMKYYPLDKQKMDEVKEVIALYKENSQDPRSAELENN